MRQSRDVLASLPKVIGHRGAAGHAPENTLASLRKAAALGAAYVEIDATLTRDGEVVILHDPELGRTTNGQGPVLLHSLAELKSLDAGGWFSEKFEGERVPTLREAAALLKDLGLGLNLEIKPTIGWQIPTAQKIAAELVDYWPDDVPLLISSFVPETLQEVRKSLPDVPLGYLTAAIPPDWQARMEEYDAATLNCAWPFVTKELAAEVHAAGYRLLAYTVNDPAVAARLFADGVDALFSDYPDRLLDLIKD